MTEPPEDGVIVYGMYLEGARWDRERKVLGESLPKILTDALPCMRLVPMETKSKPDRPKYIRCVGVWVRVVFQRVESARGQIAKR